MKLPNKLLLRPIQTYGVQLWGATKISNINRIILRLQSKALHTIFKVPFYVSNYTLHSDLKIPYISEIAKTHYKSFNSHLVQHKNTLISEFSSVNIIGDPIIRLQRQWCRDPLTKFINCYHVVLTLGGLYNLSHLSFSYFILF